MKKPIICSLPATTTAPIFPTHSTPAWCTSWSGTTSVAVAISIIIVVAFDLSGAPRLSRALYLGASVIFNVLVSPFACTLHTFIVTTWFVSHACCAGTPCHREYKIYFFLQNIPSTHVNWQIALILWSQSLPPFVENPMLTLLLDQ